MMILTELKSFVYLFVPLPPVPEHTHCSEESKASRTQDEKQYSQMSEKAELSSASSCEYYRR